MFLAIVGWVVLLCSGISLLFGGGMLFFYSMMMDWGKGAIAAGAGIFLCGMAIGQYAIIHVPFEIVMKSTVG